MTLRTRLCAPLTAAVVAALVGGLLIVGPTSATAATAARAATPAQADPDKSGSLSRSPARFPRSSYLCVGYGPCGRAGMSSAGYGARRTTMFWRMYSGHNCTNYAAYRMVRSGLPNTRPWSGGGNATYWGSSNAKLTNRTPSVGAVAWWRANTGPAGSAGHVAYVEKVVSADQIIISQDSWGGDFSWAVVTKASGNWPSGFVHFNDVPLRNAALPTISGLAKVGAQLTTTAGAWKPAYAAVTYQWFANGAPIAGATASALTLTSPLLGQTITVRTTAAKLGYPRQSVTSAATAAVLPGSLLSVTPPAIRGALVVDRTLTVRPGTWNVAPDAVSYQWYADGVPLDGATGTSLRLTPDLVGRVISLGTAASRSGYDTLQIGTQPTAPVAPGTIHVRRGPQLSGTAGIGQVLQVDAGDYRPASAISVQWLRAGQPIPGATGSTYTVAASDLGARITAQVTASRPGYTTVAQTSAASERVRTTPVLRMRLDDLRHGARLVFEVRSRLVDDVQGTLVVRLQGSGRHVLTVHDGVARLRLADLALGRHAFAVVYRGSATLQPVTRTGAFRIR